MSHHAGTRPRLIRALAAATIILAVTSIPAGTTGSVQAAGACALPLTHDTYDGFHIGVPAGWSLSSYQDTIMVAKDTAATEAAIVYPTVQTAGLTPASFFTTYMHGLQQFITTSGNAMSSHMLSGPGQMPVASLSGRVGTVRVQGRAMVSMLHYPTALGANQLVFSAYWAPTARLASDSALLAGIGRCYGPETGTVYQVYQDQVFAFALPEGWSVNDEGQDNIDLTGDGGRAYASYLLTLLPTSEAGTTPASLLNALFARLKIQVTTTISSINGASSMAMEFLGQFGGYAVHGMVWVTSSPGGGEPGGRCALPCPPRTNGTARTAG